jgi:uncharacterized repeat protein (TIGR01451 family)
MLGVNESTSALDGPLTTSGATLATIAFQSAAEVTDSTFSLTNVVMGDLNAAAIATTTQSDTVTILSALPVNVDLVNPSSGNPADQDPIVVVRGSTVTLNIKLTSNGGSVVGTANDIGYDTAVFSNPQATIGQVATDAGKQILVSTPSTGVFRVGITGINQNTIADGVVATVTFDVDVNATPGDYTLSNAPSSTDPGGNDLTTSGSSATIRVIESPLTISKVTSPGVASGENLSYLLIYGNSGGQTVNNVVINETIPANTTFVSATHGGAFDSNTGVITWNIGTLEAGAMHQTVGFTVAVSSGLTDQTTISNTTYSIAGDGISALPGSQVDSTARDPSAVTQLDLSEGDGSPGGTGSIQITLTSGPNSLAALGVDIGYDPTLFSNFSCTINPAIGSGTSADKQCAASSPSEGVFRVGILGLNQNVIPDGLVATVSFDVASTATCDSITLLTNIPSATTSTGSDISDIIGSYGQVTIACGPSVSSITPSKGTTFGGCPVTVAGSRFQSGATLSIGGSLASQASVSSETLMTAVTPSATITSGATLSASVVVTNPDNQSSDDPVVFTYVNPGDIRDSEGTLGNSDGSVSIGEVQSVINMFLTDTNVREEADSSCDGSISIGEVQQTINSFLSL